MNIALEEKLDPNGSFTEFKIEEHEGFLVVRDDLVPGGTKRRALNKVLKDFEPGKELVYSATPFGYGQLALAFICAKLGRQATIFGPKIDLVSSFLRAAAHEGANTVEIPIQKPASFEVVQKAAISYFQRDPKNRALLPPGFDSPFFVDATASVISEGIHLEPEEVWCVAGSGALSRALQKVWPEALHKIVRVRSKGSIYGVDCNAGNAEIFDAAEGFQEEARTLPPFPSSPHYDAKVWAHVRKHAKPGALVWNM